MIKGKLVDDETRCVHYQSDLDIIAIRFRCCKEYYPCFECHQETSGHAQERWPKVEWNQKAILCGVCKTELSIQEYFDADHTCPRCKSKFNPHCSRHYHLYFEI